MLTVAIAPIYKNQLVTLYRQGFSSIDSSRISFVNLSSSGWPIISDNIFENKLPVFEEDFEILIIEFEVNFSTKIVDNRVIIWPAIDLPLEISYQDIKRIYPLSDRAVSSLDLGNNIKPEKPIFEKGIKKIEEKFKLKGYFQGGYALLKILKLDSFIVKQHEDALTKAFMEAYYFRSNPKTKAGDTPVTENHLIKVLCYERYGGVFPNNYLGYLCDVGYLFAQSQKNGLSSYMESPFVVSLLKGDKNEFKDLDIKQVFELLDNKYIKVKEAMKEKSFQHATYLLYFIIREIINDGKFIRDSKLPYIVSLFQESEYKNNLTTAVWLAGSFFGYNKFFNQLNASNESNVISENDNNAFKVEPCFDLDSDDKTKDAIISSMVSNSKVTNPHNESIAEINNVIEDKVEPKGKKIIKGTKIDKPKNNKASSKAKKGKDDLFS